MSKLQIPSNSPADVVFLLGVDNTLLDGDRTVADYHEYLKHELGEASAQHYWTIFDRLRQELDYVDYLSALQRYRLEIEQGSAEISHPDRRGESCSCSA